MTFLFLSTTAIDILQRFTRPPVAYNHFFPSPSFASSTKYDFPAHDIRPILEFDDIVAAITDSSTTSTTTFFYCFADWYTITLDIANTTEDRTGLAKC